MLKCLTRQYYLWVLHKWVPVSTRVLPAGTRVRQYPCYALLFSKSRSPSRLLCRVSVSLAKLDGAKLRDFMSSNEQALRAIHARRVVGVFVVDSASAIAATMCD